MTGDSREIMEALGDRTRFSIVEALSRKPMTGDELAESVQRARSTVESHLSVLLRLNLVTRRLEDRTYYYDATPLARQYAGIAARGAEAMPASPTTAMAANDDADADDDDDTANKTKADAPAAAPAAATIPDPFMRSFRFRTRLISIAAAAAIGAIWPPLNALFSVYILMPAITLGVLAAVLQRDMKGALNMAIIASFFTSVVSYFVLEGATLMTIGILFFAVLVIMAAGGLAAFLVTRMLMRRMKPRAKK
jgi:DNA-binding transcriptional ArsR family regulator